VRSTKRGLAVLVIALAGSAVLGAIAGLIWGAVAPRVLFQEVATGAAQQVHAEDGGYILADVWFCGITAVGGLITGILGARFLVHRDNWPAALGVVLGAVGAAYLTMWIGGLIGLSTYNHQLASSAVGTYFNDSLGLSAKSALSFWPLVASAIVALSVGARHPKSEPVELAGVWPEGHTDGP
jgi:hypothetical protein